MILVVKNLESRHHVSVIREFDRWMGAGIPTMTPRPSALIIADPSQ